MPNRQRKRFIENVRLYQHETETFFSWQYKDSYMRRSPPWRHGERIAVEAGLLNDRLEPTLVRPDYNTQRRLFRRYRKDMNAWHKDMGAWDSRSTRS